MTLAESKRTKMMSIVGTFTNVNDLTELWVRLYPLGEFRISGVENAYSISFKGEFYKALYVLGIVVEAVRQAKANCHLEISCSYEDE